MRQVRFKTAGENPELPTNLSCSVKNADEQNTLAMGLEFWELVEKAIGVEPN